MSGSLSSAHDLPPGFTLDTPAPDPAPVAANPHALPDGFKLDTPKEEPSIDLTGGFSDGMPVEGSKRILQRVGHGLAGIVGLPADIVQAVSPKTPQAVSDQMSAETGTYIPPLPENKTPFGNVNNPEMAGNSTSSPDGVPMTSHWLMNKADRLGFNINPGEATTPEQKAQDIIGDVMLNAPLMGIGIGARAAPSIVSRAPGALKYLGSLAGSAAKGAIGGGISAAVETPGDMSTRAEAGMQGAEAGAVAAPVLHVAGSVVGAAANRFLGPKVDVPGMAKPVPQSTASNAGQKFADQLGEDGQSLLNTAATQPTTPGYTPTVAQAVNTPSAVAIERTARANDPGAFAIKARDQANSERAAVNTQAGTGNPTDVGTTLQTGQAATNAQGVSAVDAAKQAQQASIATTPAPVFSDTPKGFTSAEQYGADTRATLLTARQALENQRSGLQKQINQDGNVVIPTDPITANIEERYTLNKLAEQPSGKEAAIFSDMQRLPANAPLEDLQALRNRVTGTIDELTPAGTRMGDPARRLMSVKHSIDQAIDNASSNPTTSSPLIGDQRVMSPAEQQAHGQVKALNQRIASTYDNGAVGDLLGFGDHQTAAQVSSDITRAKGGFKTSDADVMSRVWDGSNNEAGNIRQFTEAGGDAARLQAFAADDLRRVSIDPKTGDFDPAKYAAWKQQHRAGLNATPELRNAFDGVEKAQAQVEQAAANHAAAMDAYNTKAVTQFIGQNPDKAVKNMFTNGDSAANLNDITTKINGDPNATAGLKRAVGDYIGDQYKPLSATGGREADLARAGQFNGFLTQHKDALTSLYGQDGYNQLSLIGKQMQQRANVSPAISAAPSKAGDTSHGNGITTHGLVVADVIGEASAKTMEHMAGAAGTVAFGATAAGYKVVKSIVKAFNRAGVKTEGQLLNLAALHPTTVGKQLLEAVKQPDAKMTPQIARRLAAVVGATVAQQETP